MALDFGGSDLFPESKKIEQDFKLNPRIFQSGTVTAVVTTATVVFPIPFEEIPLVQATNLGTLSSVTVTSVSKTGAVITTGSIGATVDWIAVLKTPE